MHSNKKTIGIIGGMGPMATVDLMRKIIVMTKADKDQGHIHMVTDCNTNIPDRTEAILHGGKTPIYELARSAIKLEAMGADALIIACNTAHYFYKELCGYVKIPIINMLTETAAEANRLGFKSAGLLCTDATLKTGLYKEAFTNEGINIITPSLDGQKAVMSLIYDVVKAGKPVCPEPLLQAVTGTIDHMKNNGAQVFILGCTELPVAFESFNIDASYIDPTAILARKAIEFSDGELA